MLNSKLLAFAGAGLLISAPIFPQHAPGFLAAGAISGGACWILGEKEREVSKRLTGVTEKERQLKSDQDNIELLKTKYSRSLADIEVKQKELAVQAQEIADQRLECEFIKSLKAGLDKRALEIQNLQSELDRVASEQKERRSFEYLMRKNRRLTEREQNLIQLYSYCQLGMTPQQFYAKWSTSYEQIAFICSRSISTVSFWFVRGSNYRRPTSDDLRHLAIMDFLLEHFEDIPEELRNLLCPPSRGE